MRLVELRPPRLQLAAWETRKPLGAVVPYDCYGFCCVALGFHGFLKFFLVFHRFLRFSLVFHRFFLVVRSFLRFSRFALVFNIFLHFILFNVLC